MGYKICGLLSLAFVVTFSPTVGEAAVSLAGTSGLINIPTASVLKDGGIVFGTGYVEGNYTHVDDVSYPMTPLWIALGYLPGLELSARLTIINGAPPQDAGLGDYKDGMASVQFRLKKEGQYLPAVVIGARDVYGFALFNALYGVISKGFSLPYLQACRGHLGIGVDWMKGRHGVVDGGRNIPIRHDFVGLFGGIEARITDHLIAMAEYDTKKVNAGVRLRFLSHINVDLALMGMRDFGGGVSFSFSLL